jgi:integrase
LTRWLAFKATLALTDKTISSYRQMAAHSQRGLGPQPLRALTPWVIQAFYTQLAPTVSPRTLRYVHVVLKMALDDAVDWGLLPSNPARKVKVGSAGSPAGAARLHIPTPDDLRQWLQANQASRWYPLWLFFATTGCRLGEALALQWGDIDWEQHTVTIQRAMSGDAARRVIKAPKTASSGRTLTLGPHMLEALRAQAAQQQAWRGAAGSIWVDTPWVFTTAEGRWLAKRGVERAFKISLQRAGLPPILRVHDIRHAVATQWLAAGVNPLVVSQRLGHTNVAFTLQVYGHVLPRDESRLAVAMETALLDAAAGRRRAAETFQNTPEQSITIQSRDSTE